MSWKLKRTKQCAKCPWRKDVNPRDIPDGYSEEKHRGLSTTIADPGSIVSLGKPILAMACHETADSHCLGWLANQAGPGNNIPLRMSLADCDNVGKVRLVGDQWDTFEETLPRVD